MERKKLTVNEEMYKCAPLKEYSIIKKKFELEKVMVEIEGN